MWTTHSDGANGLDHQGGLKLVAAGMNPMDLKRGIDIAAAAVAKDLERRAKKVLSSEEIAQVATIEANGDKSVGKMIADAMKRSATRA